MAHPYHSIDELIQKIDEPSRQACAHLLSDHRELFERSVGGRGNHQPWEGGYLHHIEEVMNLATTLYPVYTQLRELPFSLSDALLVLFLHDLEKPWKYYVESCVRHIKPEMKNRVYIKNFVNEIVERYDIVLTDEHRNGLDYVEGEIDAWSPYERKMGPLAAFAHICDVSSARIWPECPKESDLWKIIS